MKSARTITLLLLALSGEWHALGQLRTLNGHVPPDARGLQPIGRPPANRQLHLAVSLSLRDQAGLDLFLQQLYDRSSTNFHRYLTPAQVAERFGPTAQDYQAVIQFAQSNGLAVTRTYPNRLVADLTGTVSTIESAFRVTLRTYRHPTENREFYAPDTEPSVDTRLPIQGIDGLNDYALAKPLLHPSPQGGNAPGASAGSANGGNYRGLDFRNAYVPGITLNGSGQTVGLVEFDGYYLSDINAYTTQSGLPNARLVNVNINGVNVNPSGVTNNVGEVSLDIEMVAAMAPNLSAIVVFQATNANSANWISMLNTMASSNQIAQFSSSWGLGPVSTSGDQILQTMAAEGQSFFQASGDGDAYTNGIPWPSDSPYLTSVGGTTLSTTGPGGSYVSETVWNSGFQTGPPWFANGQSGYWGSGGGSSPTYPIPSWQAVVNFTGLGSTTKRNIPDVAMTANNVWVNYFNGLSGSFIGTSCAAPLWAGFTALVNQQAAATGKPTVGFLNPALYAIGVSASYSTTFHDVVGGNNFWPGSPSSFSAVTGFDLCTGWGSPTNSLISALTDYAGAVWVDFTVTGPGIGTYNNPYNTLDLGISGVANGGTVVIKRPATTTWTGTITKPLTLNSASGAATIGP